MAVPVSPIWAGVVEFACFTPQQDCTSLIVREIDQAQSAVSMQAYEFTSPQIADAIVRAARRGLSVQVIVDDSVLDQAGHQAAGLVAAGVTVLVDAPGGGRRKNPYGGGIAHSKVWIIDHKTTITGSFNATVAAQKKNAENLVVIRGADVATEFEKNFQSRLQVSRPFSASR